MAMNNYFKFTIVIIAKKATKSQTSPQMEWYCLACAAPQKNKKQKTKKKKRISVIQPVEV